MPSEPEKELRNSSGIIRSAVSVQEPEISKREYEVPTAYGCAALHQTTGRAEGSFDVPNDCGIWFLLQPSGDVAMRIELDKNYSNIHPHCHAPADLDDVYLLKGGGSGTTVFHGTSSQLGAIVMKHGGDKDTREVFSLAQIAQELEGRAAMQGEAAQAAARDMKNRIPGFVGVYISSYHLRYRGKDRWASMRSFRSMQSLMKMYLFEKERSLGSYQDDETRPVLPQNHLRRDIRVFQDSEVGFDVTFSEVLIRVPEYNRDRLIREGRIFVDDLGRELSRQQDKHSWKVTIAQREIGGPTSRNGALVLTSGDLKGGTLQKLLDEFTQVIRNLRLLTMSIEREVLEQVRQEYDQLGKSRDVKLLSKVADQFVGCAIRKNFDPSAGRFTALRSFGACFRDRNCILQDTEQIPAAFLGQILRSGTQMCQVFADASNCRTALDAFGDDYWLTLLQHAVSLESKAATDRIWTAGLTDAGLHNTFLSHDRGLDLFDLGIPQLMPVPAFLTKFLMSYFHTLGMEENDDGDWICRFYAQDGKLHLTNDTWLLLKSVDAAFDATMVHFTRDIFDDDNSVRQLLVKYIVLQLVSDASFCLLRWEEKGGGQERYGERAQADLAKWLWRSLWDIFIASKLREKVFTD